MVTETTLENYLKDTCKEAGIIYWKLKLVGRRGFPDRFLAKAGVIVFLELKHPDGTGRLSKAQGRIARIMRAAGLHVYAINSVTEFESIRMKHWGDDAQRK